MADYYISVTGTSGGTGAIGDPWDLQTGLNKTTEAAPGNTFYLRGGTYTGKYTSTLDGGTVRSYPGEWAKIDGYKTTTLTAAINATQTSFTVADGSIFPLGLIAINAEAILVTGKSGNTITNCKRYRLSSTGTGIHDNGATVARGGNQLTINGTNTTYRDFEIMTSYPSRDAYVTNQLYGRGGGITIIGGGNIFINLIIHDNLLGIFTGSSSSSTEIYGCITYNNGWHRLQNGEEVGWDPGMYLENAAGYSRVYDCISFNNFVMGMKGYGVTGPYIGGDINGSVFANNGSPMRKFDATEVNVNLLIGTDSQSIPSASVRNSHTFHQSGLGQGTGLQFGYSPIDEGTITDNYFIGGFSPVIAYQTTDLTFTGNKFWCATGAAQYTNVTPDQTQWAWNSNTYYNAQGRNVFYEAGGSAWSFATWKTNTGFDAASTETAGAPPDTVIVRPNAYESGRAHIIIYAASAPSSINVNLSTTGLANGQNYTIRNAFDYFGTAVATGTYNAASPTVSVPLNGAALNVAALLGYDYTPLTTCPNLCVMVVVGEAGAVNPAPGQPTGLTATRSSNTQINLAWTLGSGTETSVTLERSTDGTNWTEIPLAADIETYNNTSLTPATTYNYHVKATNATGDSLYSSTVTRTLPKLDIWGASNPTIV